MLLASSSHLAPGNFPLLESHRRFASANLKDICQHTNEVFTSRRPVIQVENSAAKVNFIHNQANLARTSLHFLGYHCQESSVLVDIPSMDRHMLLQFSWAGDAEIEQDGVVHQVRQGFFLPVNPGSRMLGRLHPGYQSIIVRLDFEGLEVALAKHLGRRPSDRLRFEQAPVSIDSTGHAIASLVQTICSNLESCVPLVARNPLSTQMEEMLFSLVLYSLPHQYSAELNDCAAPVPYYVHRVEKFIRQHAAESLNTADLVDAAGISSRTLQQGFRRFRNMTPMAYLRTVRLELAHIELQKPSAHSVTQIALDCGFTHLGKFALDYKLRYGERPSETLFRNAGSRRLDGFRGAN